MCVDILVLLCVGIYLYLTINFVHMLVNMRVRVQVDVAYASACHVRECMCKRQVIICMCKIYYITLQRKCHGSNVILCTARRNTGHNGQRGRQNAGKNINVTPISKNMAISSTSRPKSHVASTTRQQKRKLCF